MNKKRFIISTIGPLGDLLPFIGIAQALKNRGHEVIILDPDPDHEKYCRSAGITFHLIDSDKNLIDALYAIYNDLKFLHRIYSYKLFYMSSKEMIGPGYKAIEKLYEPGNTVLVSAMQNYYVDLFAEAYAVPAAIFSLYSAKNNRGWLSKILLNMIRKLIGDPQILPTLNKFRSKLGLLPGPLFPRERLDPHRMYLGLFPDWCAIKKFDWEKLTGFVFYDASKEMPVPPALLRFLDKGPPPILIFPNTANKHAGEFLKACLQACSLLGRRAIILSKDPEQVPPLPSTAHHELFAPISAIIPRCAAIVHQGGIGICAHGLRAGVPQLVVPWGFDQPLNAKLLYRLGVGRWIKPSKLSGKKLAILLKELLEDPRTKLQCEHWSQQVKACDAVGQTCNLLEQL